MRKGIFLLLVLIAGWTLLWAQSTQVQFVFTADVHYGISRSSFRGKSDVDSHLINQAAVAQMNRLPEAAFPNDGGNGADKRVGGFDFVAIGGDIANRAEITKGEGTIQSAAASWSQFRSDYIDGLRLYDRAGTRSPVYVVPGNHDVSNAIGSYKPMTEIDKTALTEIYNLMMHPSVAKTTATLEYPRDKVLASHDVGGVHFVFITLWPDSRVRAWIDSDLKTVSADTPVIIFAHDPPDGDPKHFVNPRGKHDLNKIDQFENLLSDTYTDLVIEQRNLETFLEQHPNITAYFHGHNNWNQFYDWTGPDHTVALHTFRVDSPLKGHFSGIEESKLSYQIATIDTAARTITVREVLWNANPQVPNSPITWGASTTVALSPRRVAAKH